MKRIKIDNPGAVAAGGVALAAVISGIALLGPAPASTLVTALSWMMVLGSTAGAGFLIFRQVEHDREAESRHSKCPRCGYATILTYRTGQQIWVHAVTDREQCGRLGHPVLPVPVSPGRPR